MLEEMYDDITINGVTGSYPKLYILNSGMKQLNKTLSGANPSNYELLVKTYEGGDDLPTEAKLKEAAVVWITDFLSKRYQGERANAYPPIGEQLDMQYHDAVNGTTTWKDAIAKVKSDNPK
tara:strand:- start:4325 stop:4687 length:363 start_codon:yes stop_codon:yes gene_type:complete